ncbi:hypothetical protein FGO68_gene5113 [Halteria grandinella]|uniref:Uncharacterized protein n=1 Tax=Halteria grandinella TaxID=5974 RepID=A0A8J8NRW0_HALGN|nr:hypothetical protein FGO68_gene5113 [Halteria grandinella]
MFDKVGAEGSVQIQGQPRLHQKVHSFLQQQQQQDEASIGSKCQSRSNYAEKIFKNEAALLKPRFKKHYSQYPSAGQAVHECDKYTSLGETYDIKSDS